MPVVNCVRDQLFKLLNQKFTDDEFRDLCFQFGIELDDVFVEDNVNTYKIEVPANRYDLLCIEGLSSALKIFLAKAAPIHVHINSPPGGVHQKLIVHKEVSDVRPVVLCAILRNVKFTPENYKSFIDLQDKLHQGVGRRRTLVSIGTHDLDTIKGPFSYEALPPKEINFVPLNQQTSFDGEQLMAHLKNDQQLKKYLHIIADKPRYPVIYDSNRTVLSLPPIINGDHSKITLKTQNIFMEVTATDHTKAEIFLNTMVAMFSVYCSDQFSVEQVEIVDQNNNTSLSPNVGTRNQKVSVEYVNKSLGLNLDPPSILRLLKRMSLDGEVESSQKYINVSVPITRTDILHECDVMEDVAIAYGFNNLKKEVPKTLTIGKQQPLNKLTDLLRLEMASAGYTEVLTLALCSREENFGFLRHPDDGSAVAIGNPKSQEYQIARTCLLAGLLKTVQHHKQESLPLKLFEISDVVLQDKTRETGARNNRRLCAVYCNVTAGFEIIHGVLDFLMIKLKVSPQQYSIQASTDAAFFPGRCVDILLHNKKIGGFGILHPEVLNRFEIPFPCSALEIDLEHFL